MIGMLDHKMHVQRETRFFAHEADNVRAEGNIIDEMAVHNVAMDPIRAGDFNAVNFLSQPREIRGQNGWSDDYSSH
jgi:hypothetical protein